MTNFLWVSAHPEPRSLSASLAREGQHALRDQGDTVVVSDLYAMEWDPILAPSSYGSDPATRFHPAEAAQAAHSADTVASDIRAEQAKIDAADVIIVQFPMWWFGAPAILKGWFDRVWHQGYAYGHRGPNGEWIGYGDGFLAGRRVMIVATLGGPDWMYDERGIHGSIDDLLFPLQHGMFFYAGADVLPPFLLHGVDRYTAEDGVKASDLLRQRLATVTRDAPIPFRHQDSGDYENFALRDGIAPGVTGLQMHRS